MSVAERDESSDQVEVDAETLQGVTAALEALLRAAGDVYEPDLVQRRRWGKAVRRIEKAAKAGRDEAVLADTGIRLLREKPVFTTPNVSPPQAFEQTEVAGEAEFREVVEPQHCYV